MIVEFAIGQSDSYSMLKVAELMEKYGKKLALVGRLISNLGDSITGLGRWLKNKQGAYTGTLNDPFGQNPVCSLEFYSAALSS